MKEYIEISEGRQTVYLPIFMADLVKGKTRTTLLDSMAFHAGSRVMTTKRALEKAPGRPVRFVPYRANVSH